MGFGCRGREASIAHVTNAIMHLLRRVRAVVAIGAAWAIPWATVGVTLVSWRVLFGSPHLAYPLRYWPRFAVGSATVLGTFGFIAGITFALALAKIARGRALDNISLRYAARWGSLAGAASILIAPLTGVTAWSQLVVAGSILALVGAASAAATLALARQADASGSSELRTPRTFPGLARDASRRGGGG